MSKGILDPYCLIMRGADKKQEKIIRHIANTIPYPQQIRDIELKEANVIRLTWRDVKFRITDTYFVEERENGMLAGSNICIILEALLKKG